MNNQYPAGGKQVKYWLEPECKGLKAIPEFELYFISNREPLKVSDRGQT